MQTPPAPSNRLRQWLTLAAVVGAIVVNFLSTRFPGPTRSVGALSNTLFAPVQIIPANYAFAIWGVIYLGLISFCIYQLQPGQQKNESLQRFSGWLIVASIAQCVWIYTFQALLFPLSTLPMLVILGSLIALYLGLGIGRTPMSRRSRWFIQYPISVYLGWITVATVVNVAIALFSLQWDGWGISPTVWTVLMMVISSAIAAAVTLRHHDLVYSLVMIWALVAIVVKHMDILPIAITGSVLAIVLGLVGFGRQMQGDRPSST